VRLPLDATWLLTVPAMSPFLLQRHWEATSTILTAYRAMHFKSASKIATTLSPLTAPSQKVL